jgi:predicted ribosome quality control (RQC) complex YloA/Tae2 family protein
MAKSFKQLAAKPEAPKRTSEKDILDFLEQEQPAKAPTPAPTPAVDNTGNTSKPVRSTAVSNISNTTANAKADSAERIGVTNVTSEDIDVRQTFIVGQHYLDRLKDYVHTKRMSGQYEYTQKQALHDALDKLFEGATIESRPAHIRQQEETRKQRIRRGIPK